MQVNSSGGGGGFRKPSSTLGDDLPPYRAGCNGRSDDLYAAHQSTRTTRLDSTETGCSGCDQRTPHRTPRRLTLPAGDDGCQTALLPSSESPLTSGRRTSSLDACSGEPSPCDPLADTEASRSRRSTVDDCYRSMSIDGSCDQTLDDDDRLERDYCAAKLLCF